MEKRKKIYRYYSDTEIYQLATNVKCPYCGHEDQLTDHDACGTTYEIECWKCEQVYEMYFDAD